MPGQIWVTISSCISYHPGSAGIVCWIAHMARTVAHMARITDLMVDICGPDRSDRGHGCRGICPHCPRCVGYRGSWSTRPKCHGGTWHCVARNQTESKTESNGIQKRNQTESNGIKRNGQKHGTFTIAVYVCVVICIVFAFIMIPVIS